MNQEARLVLTTVQVHKIACRSWFAILKEGIQDFLEYGKHSFDASEAWWYSSTEDILVENGFRSRADSCSFHARRAKTDIEVRSRHLSGYSQNNRECRTLLRRVLIVFQKITLI